MRYLLPGFGTFIAILLIGYYTITLGWTAFDMMPDGNEMSKWLYATGIACAVIVECVFLVFGVQLWHHGQKLMAVFCGFMLVAAAAYTTRFELAYHITGQADTVAQREAGTKRRVGRETDLAYLRQRRDEIGSVRAPAAIEAELESYRQHRRWHSTSGCTDATVPQSISYCAKYEQIKAELKDAEKLEEITAEIKELRDRQDWTPVAAGGSPVAAWMARRFGNGEEFWRDLMWVVAILFGLLARTFALPIAFGAFRAARAERGPVPQAVATLDAVADDDEPEVIEHGTNVVPLERKPEAYQADQDTHLRDFFATRSPDDYEYRAFYNGYVGWCDRNGVKPLYDKKFSNRVNNETGWMTYRPNGATETRIAPRHMVPAHLLARGQGGGAQTELVKAA